MRRIVTTIFAVVALAIVVFIVTQAQGMGAPWMFTAVGILMIVGILISVIRAWLHR